MQRIAWLIAFCVLIATTSVANASPVARELLLENGDVADLSNWIIKSSESDSTSLTYRFRHDEGWELEVQARSRVSGSRFYAATEHLALSYVKPEFELSPEQKADVEALMSRLVTVIAANERPGLLEPENRSAKPVVREEWLDPIRGETGDPVTPGMGWSLATASLEGKRLSYVFTHSGGSEMRLFVAPKTEEREAFATTDRFSIWYSLDVESSPDMESQVQEGIQSLVERIDANEEAGTLPGLSGSTAGTSSLGVSGVLIGLDVALLALWFVVFVFLLIRLARRREFWTVGAGVSLGAVLVLAVVARLWFEPALVKVGMVFPVMDAATGLHQLPRYGAAGPVLYHLLFQIFPIHTDTILFAHGVLSVLNVGLWFFLARDLFQSWRVALVVGLVAAVTPVVVRHDLCESLLVPGQLFLLTGMLLLEDFRKGGGYGAALGAALALALASHVRPELGVLVAVWVVSTVLLTRELWLRRSLWISAALLVALWIPYGLYQLAVIPLEAGRSNLSFESFLPGQLLHNLWSLNLLMQVHFFPVVLSLLAGVGIVLGIRDFGKRKNTLRVLLFAVVWLVVYYLDFNRESMLRLHVPPALAFTLLAGVGLERMLVLMKSRWGKVALVAVAGVLFLGNALATLSPLQAGSNSRTDAQVFEHAVAALPDEPVNWIELRWEDTPGKAWSPEAWEEVAGDDIATANVHRNYPDYLLHPPLREGRLYSVRHFWERPDFKRRSFFYLGTACYAMRENHGYEQWPVEEAPYLRLHPACRLMLSHFELEPVHIEYVPNRSELAPQFQWVPPEVSGMTVGVFEVHARLERPRPGDSFAGLAHGYYEKAKTLMEEEDLDAAEAVLLDAYEGIPESPTMWEMMGSFYFLKGSLDKHEKTLARAMEFWERLADRDSYYPMLLKQYGSVFGQYSRFLTREERDAWIERRLDRDPDDLLGWHLKGMYLYYDKEYEKSLEILEAVLKRIDTDPRVYVYLSLDHFFLGNQQKAEELIGKGVEIAGDVDPDLYYVRSMIYRRKDLQMAAEDIRRYLKMSEGADKVRNAGKEAWLKEELKRVKAGNPSSWWDEDLAAEPWTE